MKKLLTLFITVTLIGFSGNLMAAINIKLGLVTKPGSAQNVAAEKFGGSVQFEGVLFRLHL